MSEPLWKFRNIEFGSPGLRLQVENLSIYPGVTAVIGASGAGKSSLLNLLTGFDAPTSGTVECLIDAEERMAFSWLPSDFGLWPSLTVREHLGLVSPEGPASESINTLLDRFDLGFLADEKPNSLSMGERARLGVARCLASNAVVHVMDEPFVHVDPGRVGEYWDVIRETVESSDSSLVFVSHSPTTVLREADQVVCLQDGRIVWKGKPLELYHTPPNPELGRLVGPLNWIESTQVWDGFDEKTKAIRPENLSVEEDSFSPLTVRSSAVAGAYQETDITHPDFRESVKIFHRPTSTRIEKGARIALKFVTIWMITVFLIFLSGCATSESNDPMLVVKQSRRFALPSEGAMLPAPRGMTFGPDEELYVLDTVGRVVAFDKSGKEMRRWWMPEYDIGRPEGVWVLHDGRIAVADTHYHRVVFFNTKGELLGMFGEKGDGPGQFIYTNGVTQDPDGFLYVTEYGGNDRVQKFTADGEFVTMFGEMGTEEGQFQRPSGIVWQDGVVYVADAINNRIQSFTDDGKFLKVVADAHTAGLYYPYDLAQGPDGSLYVPEYGAGRISRISTSGELLGHYGQEGRGEGQFWTPWGIAVSQNNKVAVADTGNRRVVELNF